MKITCVRHGKPEFVYPSGRARLTAFEFNELLDRYDAAGLDWPWNLERNANRQFVGFSLSSDLPRAVETAHLVSGAAPAQQSELYREVPLPRFRVKERRLPGALFMGISRLGWYLGTMRGPELRRDTMVRVQRAADELEGHSKDRGHVFLYAHGFFLWLLGQELRRRGWQTQKRGPYRYLEAAEFVPGISK